MDLGPHSRCLGILIYSWGHWSTVHINLSVIWAVLGNSIVQSGPSGQKRFKVEAVLGNQVEWRLGFRYLFGRCTKNSACYLNGWSVLRTVVVCQNLECWQELGKTSKASFPGGIQILNTSKITNKKLRPKSVFNWNHHGI